MGEIWWQKDDDVVRKKPHALFWVENKQENPKILKNIYRIEKNEEKIWKYEHNSPNVGRISNCELSVTSIAIDICGNHHASKIH